MDLNDNLASILTLIAALAAAVVSIVNAWRSTNRAYIADKKITEIHDATNGNLSKLQEKMDIVVVKATNAEARANSLQDIVTNLTSGKVVVTEPTKETTTKKSDKG